MALGLKTIRLRTNPVRAKKRKKTKAIKRKRKIAKRRAGPRRGFIIQGIARGANGFPKFYYLTAAHRWHTGRARAKRYATIDSAVLVMKSAKQPAGFAAVQIVPA